MTVSGQRGQHFLGMTVDGFPNMFLVTGPQSPFGNVPVMIENEVRWIGAAIEHGLHRNDRVGVYRALRDAVPGFRQETG